MTVEELVSDHFQTRGQCLFEAMNDRGSQFGRLPRELMAQIAGYDFDIGMLME
jgi:hypothetical protein